MSQLCQHTLILENKLYYINLERKVYLINHKTTLSVASLAAKKCPILMGKLQDMDPFPKKSSHHKVQLKMEIDGIYNLDSIN